MIPQKPAQNKKILVAGSLAYDHVMSYDGLFKNVILPEKLDRLSVTFTSPTKSAHFGGCGGNIAYSLKLLGVEPLLLGVAGKDFGDYQKWLEKNGINTKNCLVNEDLYTACATILTDQEQNQLTIFHEGAMASMDDAFQVADHHPEELAWAIISPDNGKRMVRFAQQCAQLKIPYIFDPSQQIANLSAEELSIGIQGATILIANDYETVLMAKKLGITPEQLSAMTPYFIETHGAKGVRIYDNNQKNVEVSKVVELPKVLEVAKVIEVPAVFTQNIVDPTGCGDAFRAGVLAGLVLGYNLEKSCKIGALTATYNLEQKGTQGHRFTLEEFAKRFEESFGEKL